MIVANVHGIFTLESRVKIISWLRSSAKRKNLGDFFLNKHMQITPITTEAISTTQNVQTNRVETVRREYVDNAGRVEIKETYYYYYVYDDKGRVEESTPNTVDLRV
jgi:hypothetical protein